MRDVRFRLGPPVPTERRGRLPFILLVVLPLMGLALGIGSIVSSQEMTLEGWDTTADWLSARAALNGSNPYRPVEEIGLSYGVEVGEFPDVDPAPHPRSPGALALQAPLLLLDVGVAVTVIQGVSLALATFLVCALLLRIEGGLLFQLALGATILLSIPSLAGVFYGAESALVATLLFGSVFWMNRGRNTGAGVLLGIATTLKLFPALAVLVLVRQRRWSMAVAAVATFFTLNLGGMIAWGVSLQETMDAMRTAALAWVSSAGNLSLAGIAVSLGTPIDFAITAAPLVGVVMALLVATRTRNAVPLVLLAAPAFSPLAWAHYQLAAVGLLAETGLPIRVLTGVASAWILSWGLYTAIATLSVPHVSFSQGLLFLVSVFPPIAVFLTERAISSRRQVESALAPS